MPRVNHNVGHSNASNHVQQTNLLTRIEENTKNINVNVGDVEVNVQDVEDLITITNTKLSGGLPSALTGSGHLSISIDEIGNTGSEKLNVNLDTQISQHFPTALSGSGRLKVESHITDHSKESKQDTAIGHLATVAGTVSGSEMQVDVVTMPTVAVTLAGGATEAKQDDGITQLTTLAGTVGENGMQVEVASSVLPSGAATQSTLSQCYDELENILTSLNIVSGATTEINTGAVVLAAGSAAIGKLAANSGVDIGDVDVTSLPLTFNSGNKDGTCQRVVIATDDINLAAIKTSVQLIDNAMHTGVIPSAALNVSVASSTLPSGAATESSLAAINGKITVCNTGAVVLAAGTAAIGKLSANDGVDIGDVDVASLPLTFNSGNKDGTCQRVVIATDDINLSAIKTAVETIDNAIDGSEMQCDIVSSALPSGASTAALQGAGLPTALSSDNLKVSLKETVDVPITNTTLTNLNNCIGTNELQIDIVAALPAGTNAIGKLSANSGVDIGDVDVTSLPLTFNSGNKDGTCQRVVVATDDVNLSAIKTSVELIDNAIDGSEMQCDIVSSALPSGASTSALQGGGLPSALSSDNLKVSLKESIDVGITHATLTNLNNCIGTNELQVDIVAALPAGTNAIGKLAANSGVDIGDVDVTSLPLTFNSGNKDGTCQRVVVATDDVNLSAIKTAVELIDDCIGTDGSTGPAKCISIGGTFAGDLQEIFVDGDGHLQIDILSSALPSGAATDISNSAIATAAVNILTKTTLATTSELKELLSGVTINAGALSSEFDTENYDKIRFFGETTAAVGNNISLMGSNASGGTFYHLGESLRDQTVGSTHYIYGANIENLPRYIKIINTHGSTNYVFTKLYMQLSGGRLAV